MNTKKKRRKKYLRIQDKFSLDAKRKGERERKVLEIQSNDDNVTRDCLG